MDMDIIVDRHQYGIGQGCFHAQRIAIKNGIEGENEYRFVYDVGVEGGTDKYLQWGIRHLAGTDDPTKKSLYIDTVFLSHFHGDHISGLEALVDLTNVGEIVIPYLPKELVLCIVAEGIDRGTITEASNDTIAMLKIIEAAAGGGDILGVKTTRVYPGRRDNDNGGNTNDGGEDTGGEANRENTTAQSAQYQSSERFIKPTQAPQAWSDETSRHLGIADAAGNPLLADFWEFRVWSYCQKSSVSTAVHAELSALTWLPKPGCPLTNLLSGVIDKAEIAWAVKNKKQIQDAYTAGLKAAGVPSVSNHNIVSLCLYSGPKNLPDSAYWHSSHAYSWKWHWNYHNKKNHPSWLGTGDACLGDSGIWKEFEDHFQTDRLQSSGTILMPHHGSGRGNNHNEKLLNEHTTLAIFSAGATNQWQHPNREVLESVDDCYCSAVTVTEFARPGFFERLELHYFDKSHP